MPELAVTISCRCGWEKTLTPGDEANGQTLGGTAGDLAARHSASCGGSISKRNGYNWEFVEGGDAS